MSYYDTVLAGMKRHAPDKVEELEGLWEVGKARVTECNQIFRVMCLEENRLWNEALKLKKGQGLVVDESTLERVYVGGNNYPRRWFVFNRPYRFNSQRANDPRKVDTKVKVRGGAKQPFVTGTDGGFVDSRKGAEFLLTIQLNPELKALILDRLLPDRHLKAAQVSRDLLARSVRVKSEGGTYTLGIPLPTLKEIASSIRAEDIQSGGRLVPLMNFPDIIAEMARGRTTGTTAAVDAGAA